MKIRPVSDLRNKYPEIENLVINEDEEVYLTKNGYGTMVVVSMDKYSKLIDDTEYDYYLGKAMDEAEAEAENPKTKYYSHDQIFSEIRSIIDDKKEV